jgi:hypothetical protein
VKGKKWQDFKIIDNGLELRFAALTTGMMECWNIGIMGWERRRGQAKIKLIVLKK